MTTTQIDGKWMKGARARINDALAELGKELGVQFEAGNGSYDASGLTGHFKLLIKSRSLDGLVIDQERADFTTLAKLYDMEPAWIDQPFPFNGKQVKITGLRSKATKNNVRIEDVRTGKVYVAPSIQIARAAARGLRDGQPATAA